MSDKKKEKKEEGGISVTEWSRDGAVTADNIKQWKFEILAKMDITIQNIADGVFGDYDDVELRAMYLEKKMVTREMINSLSNVTKEMMVINRTSKRLRTLNKNIKDARKHANLSPKQMMEENKRMQKDLNTKDKKRKRNNDKKDKDLPPKKKCKRI